MKIENLERALVASVELANLDHAIAQFDNFVQDTRSTGFILTEHRDLSGFCAEVQYKDGNYHPMYAEILEFAREKFIQARLDLLKEISEL